VETRIDRRRSIAALEAGEASRFFSAGRSGRGACRRRSLFSAPLFGGPAPNAPLETLTATAR
jgi:hypothetical protein